MSAPTAHSPPRIASRPGQRGLTLVELMVAMALGLFLIGGALFVYDQGRNSYRMTDSVARLQETARFALESIEPDVRLARFWGLNASPGTIDVPAAVRINCSAASGGSEVTAWALDLETGIAGRDDIYDLECRAFGDDPQPGSDVLIVRHAEPAGRVPTVPEAGRVQVQSALAGGRLFDDGVAPDLGADSATFNVAIHAWYVSRQSSFEPGQPSLRRLTLKKGRIIGDDEVITGVENLQVQFGVDTDRNGSVDRYVDGDHPLVTPGAAGFAAAGEIIAVRLWMLVATPADDPAWVDTTEYATPDADLGPLAAGSEGYPEGHRRLPISKTILLRNRTG